MDISDSQCCTMPCSKSELDIRHHALRQQAILNGKTHKIYPITQVTDQMSVMEFFVPGSGEEYIDPNYIYLHVKLKIVQADDDKDLETTDDVAFDNMPFCILFKDLIFFMNEKQVSSGTGGYDYRCVVESLLSYNVKTLETQLSTIGWAPNVAGQFNPSPTNVFCTTDSL